MMNRVTALAAVALLACATAAARDPYIDSSDESMRTAEGLYPVRNAKFQLVFAKPGVDLSAFDAFLLDTVEIAYKEDRRRRREPGSARSMRTHLNDRETRTMQSIFDDVFHRQLAGIEGFTAAEGPGDGVLRVTPAILDLVINVPLDPTPSRSRVFVDSVADMTLLLELRDSVSGELLVKVAERREARRLSNLQMSTPVNDRREVERLLERWARLMSQRLEAVREMSIETQ